jgi:predicted permease
MTRRATPPRIPRLLVRLFIRGDAHDEIAGDLDEDFGAAIDAGTSRADASRRYWRGALASIRDIRDARRERSLLFQGVTQDISNVVRRLAASPGFSAVAILSLAVGIGANTAIASIARAALFDPLPVDRPDELVMLCWQRDIPQLSQINSSSCNSGQESSRGWSTNFSFAAYSQLKERAPAGAELFAFTFIRQANVSINQQPAVAAGGLLASGSYFSAVRPGFALGRGFTADDDRQGAEVVAVISHSFWKSAFAGSPSVLDTPIAVNGVSARIIGVTGPGFRGLSPGGFFPTTEITVPLAAQPVVMPQFTPSTGSLFTSDRHAWLRVLGRAPEGPARAALLPMLETTMRGYVQGANLMETKDLHTVRGLVLPGVRGLNPDDDTAQRSIFILAAIVGVVLFIACLNLAGLLLARGVSRQRELSVRRALGASRWRLIRLTLIESLVISLLGAGAGLVLAIWSQQAVAAVLSTGIGAVNAEMPFDLRLLGTTIAFAMVAAILCGLLPALRLSGARMTSHLQARPGGSTAPRLLAGRALLVLQIAISVPLVTGAGLLLRSLNNLHDVPLGFEPASLVLFKVEPLTDRREPGKHLETYDRVLANLRDVPGVSGVTLVENALVGGLSSGTSVKVGDKRLPMRMNAIGPGFFDTMGIPVVAGRALTAEDREGGPGVVMINESAAVKYFQGDALGRRMTLMFFGEREVEVVGVVADAKYESIRGEIMPTFYDSYRQRPVLRAAHFIVRTAAPPASLERPIRDAVARANPLIALTEYKSQLEQIDKTIVRERVFAKLLTMFGAFALLLACIGLHGVTSYAVARRTAEIGVRVALGATRAQVSWLVVRHVILLGALGLAIGVPLALAAGPAIQAMLFGLTPGDPWTMTWAALTMFGVTLLAGWLPARKAATIDPLAAMRTE